MKWFQLDSDMPNDPKIRAVTRALGAEGLGGLVGIWCHIAAHGRRPGQGIDSAGLPFPVDDIQAASLLGDDKFQQLMATCLRTGHFQRDAWELHHGIYIPAMQRRGDRYTQRLQRQGSLQLDLEWKGKG